MQSPKRKSAEPLLSRRRSAEDFPSLHLIDHALVEHKLTQLRDVNRPAKEFRLVMREVGLLMGYEITRDLPLAPVEIDTPFAKQVSAKTISMDNAVVVPILRAGLVFAESLQEIMSGALIGHVGIHRDSGTLKSIEYLVKLPDLTNRKLFLVDPVIATGNTACCGIQILKSLGVPGEEIIFMSLIIAKQGMQQLAKLHPDVKIFGAALDEELNSHGYVVPGLGDVGDRLFGTQE